MKTWLAAAMIIASVFGPDAAHAAAVCYINHNGNVYSSYAFRYEGEAPVDESPQAKAFGDYARQQYGLPADTEAYCSFSDLSVAEENEMRTERTFTSNGITLTYVNTSFQPKHD